MNDSDLQVPNSEEEYYERILSDWIQGNSLFYFTSDDNGTFSVIWGSDRQSFPELKHCQLNGRFTALELEAIVWWMEKHAKT